MRHEPGVNRPNVVTARDVLASKVVVSQSVVIIGGGLVGCETGHYLAEAGKKVVIIEKLQGMADDMFPMVRRRLINGLREKQVTMLTGATWDERMQDSVIVNTSEGQKEMLQADTVILAVGYTKNVDLSG